MQIGKDILTRAAATLLIATGLGSSLLATAASIPEGLKQLSIGGEKVNVTAVEPSPVSGLYRVRLDTGDAFYADASGHYMMTGNLYENTPKGLLNLTRQQEARERKDIVQGIRAEDAVTFKPAGKVHAVIRVFTDSTCPYCQKLHAEVGELNRQGVEVRYQMFPRTGPESASAQTLAAVLCSRQPTPTEALSAAMRGEKLRNSGKECVGKVGEQYALGLKLGVKGTPAIFLENGEQLDGYLPAPQLVQALGLDYQN
ncbi:DsbC family protein [Zymobacter palmae]|uniref:Thiol:disulfide interchange protein n=1 Tax=Zymobacter palmae TaxID=33074 RepID=A0A348HC94_9GAMM|nr:DsbC family protein [Zymobacter palmae]BBG29246.1 protein-disulfide isomerase [Zymobacter palmae]